MEREPFDPSEFERIAADVAWVARVWAFIETGSTNDEAVRLARDGAPEGTVVVADAQTAGRGRLDRRWIAEPGEALSASWVVRFAGPPQERPLLTLATAVAAATATERLSGVAVRLKWPNDLQAGGRKLGGILAEVAGDAVVVGLGINVRQPWFDGELAETATSLLMQGSRPVGRATLLGAVLAEFAPFAADPRAALAAYRELCDTVGREVRVDRPAGPLVGTAESVDDMGALVVLADGGCVAVNAGDVVHVR